MQDQKDQGNGPSLLLCDRSNPRQCDEVHPICGNCSRRFVGITSCDYVQPSRKRTSLASSLVSTTSSDSPCLSSTYYRPLATSLTVPYRPFAISSSSNSRALELRLMHHYTQSTCSHRSTMDSLPSIQYCVWEVDIPQMAFSSDVILDALLSISALRLLSLTPKDPEMAYASRFYFLRALNKHRKGLMRSTATSMETLLVTAILIIHHSWLASHTIADADNQLGLDTFRLCEGTRVMAQNAPEIVQRKFGPTLGLHQTQQTTGKVVHKNFLDSALKDLSDHQAKMDVLVISSEDRSAYKEATQELHRRYVLLALGTIEMAILETEIVTICHHLPTRFLQLVEQHDPMAQSLLARNIALLSLFPDSPAWWIHGTIVSKISIQAVRSIGGSVGPEWQWAMEWPLRVIRQEVKLDM